jgi:hypothetical protein
MYEAEAIIAALSVLNFMLGAKNIAELSSAFLFMVDRRASFAATPPQRMTDRALNSRTALMVFPTKQSMTAD